MKNTNLLPLLWILLLFCPATARAEAQKPEINVNERYTVESVEISGAPDSTVSKTLQEEMQKLVGEKYSQKAARQLASDLRRELPDYDIEIRVRRGEKPEHVKVVFEAEKIRRKHFELPIPPVVYHSKEGFSGSIEIPFDIHHNVFTFGLVSNADSLLERNSGFRLRYEHTKLGTDAIRLRMDFDTYHQTFNQATQAALAESPEVPGVYRTRQNFAPSLSLLPIPDLKVSFGVSFQRFQTQYPAVHTQNAYAGTGEVQFRRVIRTTAGIRQDISAAYGLRTATRALDSEFVYSRHFWTAGYSLTQNRHTFGVQFQGGIISGTAPLFERFSMGNSFTLRGWNKFDVAPLGGSRAAHGSVEYRYRPFQIFYDVGTVWDKGQSAKVRHGLGFGLALRNGFFASMAFPVRLHDVNPVLILGFRY
jgi:hypothetical protein